MARTEKRSRAPEIMHKGSILGEIEHDCSNLGVVARVVEEGGSQNNHKCSISREVGEDMQNSCRM